MQKASGQTENDSSGEVGNNQATAGVNASRQNADLEQKKPQTLMQTLEENQNNPDAQMAQNPPSSNTLKSNSNKGENLAETSAQPNASKSSTSEQSNNAASEPAKSRRHRLREKLVARVHSKHGLAILYFITFIESAFFPIPPDFLVVPMIVAKPESWKKIGFWVSLFSILGSFLGYFIGAVLFSTVGELIVDSYSLQDEMVRVGQLYNDNAFWSLLVAAFTPLPYKVFTIAAGVFQVDLVAFTLASIIGRGARYWLVAYLAHVGGNKAFWRYLRGLKRTTWVGIILAAAAGIILWRLL